VPGATVTMPLRSNTAGPFTCRAVFPVASTPVPPPTLEPTTPTPNSHYRQINEATFALNFTDEKGGMQQIRVQYEDLDCGQAPGGIP